MSSDNEAPRDTPPETVHSLAKGLAALAREFEPIQKRIQETAVLLQPLTETLASLATVAAPFVQAAARGMERWDTAEYLLKRGWVPNHTTPFHMVAECGDDDTRLQTSLLAYYTDSWPEVRASLESRNVLARYRRRGQGYISGSPRRPRGRPLPMCPADCCSQSSREYSVGRCSKGGQGKSNTTSLVTRLTGDAANLELADFLTAGIQDMVLVQVPDRRRQEFQRIRQSLNRRRTPNTSLASPSESTRRMSSAPSRIRSPPAMR